MENSSNKRKLFLILQKFTFILTIVILCLSFSCFNIIPSINSVEFKEIQKLEQKKLNIKLLSKIEFLEVRNMTLNYSSYLPFGKYIAIQLLDENETTNNITTINKDIYRANDYVMKVKYSIFNFESYNKEYNSCNKGYKSCGEISYLNFKLYCVEENDECPINEFFFSNSSEFTNSGKVYNTIKTPFNFYIHYLQYNSNDHFNKVLEDIGFTTLRTSSNNQSIKYTIERFQCFNDSTSTYSNGTSTESNYYYNNYSFHFSEIASANGIKYYDYYLFSNISFYIGYLLSPYKNLFDLQLGINSSNYDEDQRLFYYCNDMYNLSFRDEVKNIFNKVLVINLIFAIISFIFLTIEMIIFKRSDKIIPKLSYFFLITRMIETIFILILFILDSIIVSRYNFDLQEKLCINYKKGYHVIFILLCILLLFSHIFIIYLFQNLKKLSDLIINTENNNINQNEEENKSIDNPNRNIEHIIGEHDQEKEELENWKKILINRQKKIEEKENNFLFIEESHKNIIQSKTHEIEQLNDQFIELTNELKNKRKKNEQIFDEII